MAFGSRWVAHTTSPIIFLFQDKRKLIRNYVENGSFRYDVFSLLPLDFLYLRYGVEYTILRLPRLLKFGDFLEFFTRLGLSRLVGKLVGAELLQDQ